ncbi:23S rRNA (cytidine1920-2'-O)/16S rRNA (cytidine1409-2'-O)-methyltransferase [Promicromonospora sp. AC04]|uniref:TlyA family RNA methyltransferase n=1 Tax=Promicromonospora sp. AC04 TaxID=2135723 RepID=UPI000D36CB86|nr:TlyA family RNA methyltransferase [Promicromonospora sp. AC04]PUB20944.1 23S rRNA (cytidine1920-2'-O)/16S rRNA (cytidine1409-2'-O)-methyltransferase [Promicromonospora sp. AC04]
MTASTRVDAELVRRGLARSRRHAAELVASGRVSVASRVVAKPSSAVSDGEEVSVAPGPDPEHEFASRAALKLAGALDALARVPGGPVVEGAFCADLGASTGGFTDVLLRRGAAHVVAVDVGHDQLVPALRADDRVTVVEGFNVRDLTPGDLARLPDLVVADLSFISLTVVLPAVAGVLRPGAQALLMVKPQFEVGRERLGSGGVVRDPALHAEAVTTVARAAEGLGLRVRAVVPSPLPGPSGNREFFVWLTPAAGPRPGSQSGSRLRGQAVNQTDEREQALAVAVGAAVAWDPAQGEPAGRPGHPPEPPAAVVREPQSTGRRTGRDSEQSPQESTQQAEQKEREP